MLGPVTQNRIDDFPARLQRVASRIKRRIAQYGVEKQSFVSVGQIVVRQRIVAKIHTDLLDSESGPRHFQSEAQRHAFVRLNSDRQLVARAARALAGEQPLRRRLEANDDLRFLSVQLLSRVQQKRHAAPAPVIDVEFHRDERLGHRVRRNVLFLAVSPVLRPHDVAIHPLRRIGMQRAEDLDDLVPHGFRLEHGRRFHGDKGHELHQMILHHVAHGSGPVVVFSPAFHAEGFGSPYFHPVDVVPVPQRLEDSV